MSSIANAQLAMNYKRAGQRQACGNCRHVTERLASGGITVFYCARGGFCVTALAVCAHHQPRPRVGA